MINKIGFMQGRLSPIVGGKIQAFPWDDWSHEFPLAHSLGLKAMEWTLDQAQLDLNPLLTVQGQKQIRQLCEAYQLTVPSLTGDCFMQTPFWKVNGERRLELEEDFIKIAHACSSVGVETIVVPLVDNGALDTARQEDILVEFLLSKVELFRALRLRIIFESDFVPKEVARFVAPLPKDSFGINYDIGNSAALGYLPKEEFAAYGSRILNVHIKDRLSGGTTVPLGSGNADFLTVFRLLREVCYEGNLIMQTARASDGDHAGALSRYMSQISAWMQEAYNGSGTP